MTRNVGDTSYAIEASIASTATTDIASKASNSVIITGTTTITSFGTAPNRLIFLRFAGALLLTYNATSLILPGRANITTAAGDCAIASSDSAGNWTVRAHVRASGKPVVGPASAEITDATATGLAVLTGSATTGAQALGVGPNNAPTFAGLNITPNGDATILFEDKSAPTTSYRQKIFFSSKNINGGNDTLLRTGKPSDGTFLDYVFSANYPGTILTTGYGSTSGLSVLTGTPAQGATALGLGTGNSPTFAGLSVTSYLQLTDRMLYLRGSGDNNHGLRYMGGTSPWGAANLTGPDGPVLHGFAGGTLGIGSTTGGSAVVTWSGSGLFLKAGALHIDVSGSDALINMRAGGAATDQYPLGQIYKSKNVDGGSSFLFRNIRDSDGATIDHILPWNWPGRILTTGRFNPDSDVALGGVINFGNRTTQHINLWGSTYGLGVQSSTLYARTDQNGGFCLFGGGSHSNNSNDPGGGTMMMQIIASQSSFYSPIKPPSYTVSTLPTPGIAGRQAWASNGRAYNGAGGLQGSGAGTGVLVSDDGTAWRVVGTNQTVQA